MDAAEALQVIRDIARGDCDNVMQIEHKLTLETPANHGACRHCA
jgi:hypothetical protein